MHGRGVKPIAVAGLADALGLGPKELVALVGGGGKTTALLALGRQLSGPRVLTTTTKMGRSRTGGFPVLWAPSDDEVATAMAAGSGAVLVWSEGDEHKVHGVTPEVCDRWFRQLGSVVVEADGSRRKPFKAPLHYEPVVPCETTVLVACVGVDALGAVIADGCHRPSVVAEVAGCAPDDRLTPARLATVLTSSRGSAKGRPPGARFAVLINQVADRHLDDVAEVARLVVDRIPEAIIVAVAPHTSAQAPD